MLLGIEKQDGPDDVVWLVNKLINLRIFNDQNGVMNESLIAVDGNLLVISQFTLMASTKRGNRPSYSQAAGHEIAIPLYKMFVTKAEEKIE